MVASRSAGGSSQPKRKTAGGVASGASASAATATATATASAISACSVASAPASAATTSSATSRWNRDHGDQADALGSGLGLGTSDPLTKRPIGCTPGYRGFVPGLRSVLGFTPHPAVRAAIEHATEVRAKKKGLEALEGQSLGGASERRGGSFPLSQDGAARATNPPAGGAPGATNRQCHGRVVRDHCSGYTGWIPQKQSGKFVPVSDSSFLRPSSHALTEVQTRYGAREKARQPTLDGVFRHPQPGLLGSTQTAPEGAF